MKVVDFYELVQLGKGTVFTLICDKYDTAPCVLDEIVYDIIDNKPVDFYFARISYSSGFGSYERDIYISKWGEREYNHVFGIYEADEVKDFITQLQESLEKAY